MKKEDLVKFYQTYKFFLFPAVVALSSLFLIMFAIIPQTGKLLENQKKADQLNSKLKFLETKVSALENYDNTDLSGKVEVSLQTLPQERDFGNILGLLQGLVSQSGFSITAVSLEGAGGKAANSQSYPVKLQVKGGKALFQTLLNNLENSPRLIRVSSIDISSQASGSLDASLTLEALFSPLPQNFGTADVPLPQITQKEEEMLAALATTSEAGPSSAVTPSSPRGKSNPFE